MNKHEEFITNAHLLQELLECIISDTTHAYEVLMNYDGDVKYILSLGYLNMAHQSYLEAKKLYRSQGMDHYEIEPFFDAFEQFKFQLKEVITKRDENTSWLYGARERLNEQKRNADEFISNFLKNAK